MRRLNWGRTLFQTIAMGVHRIHSPQAVGLRDTVLLWLLVGNLVSSCQVGLSIVHNMVSEFPQSKQEHKKEQQRASKMEDTVFV